MIRSQNPLILIGLALTLCIASSNATEPQKPTYQQRCNDFLQTVFSSEAVNPDLSQLFLVNNEYTANRSAKDTAAFLKGHPQLEEVFPILFSHKTRHIHVDAYGKKNYASIQLSPELAQANNELGLPSGKINQQGIRYPITFPKTTDVFYIAFNDLVSDGQTAIKFKLTLELHLAKNRLLPGYHGIAILKAGHDNGIDISVRKEDHLHLSKAMSSTRRFFEVIDSYTTRRGKGWPDTPSLIVDLKSPREVRSFLLYADQNFSLR